jgi:hypothetical protein
MKNKGYYSWIHAVNQAGLQSQKKAIDMLNEAKKAGRPAKPDTVQRDSEAEAQINAQIRAQGDNRINMKRSATQLANFGRPANLAPIGDANDEADQHDEVGEMLDTSNIEDSDLADFFLQARQASAIRKHAEINQIARLAEIDKKKKARAAYDESSAEFADEMTGAGQGPLSRGAGLHPYAPNFEQLPESVSQKINRFLKG